jgi:hypothetical protein
MCGPVFDFGQAGGPPSDRSIFDFSVTEIVFQTSKCRAHFANNFGYFSILVHSLSAITCQNKSDSMIVARPN